MRICVCDDAADLGAAAARGGAWAIARTIRAKGSARIVVATGTSQFETLKALVEPGLVDWRLVEAFHLDEYVGIGANHPASFRRYLRERFVEKLPSLPYFEYVAGDAPDLGAELRRLSRAFRERPVDVAFIGIGENSHIAFNDPPADFETEEPYIVVDLDEACRAQQVGEGWYPSLDAVPRQAVSMSVRAIMSAATIIASVPEARKAEAVRLTLQGEVSPERPASILRRHSDCWLFLDRGSAGKVLRVG
jgi:glucosamine-6-phosphate deaminase